MREIKTAVVTGATSFIGSAVCQALLNRGCEVFGIVRPESVSRNRLPTHPHFHEVLCELSNTEVWVSAIGQADSFFHFAWGGPGIDGRSNVDIQKQSANLAMLCVRAAARLGVGRFFLSGSQAEYGRVSGIIREETPCHPVLEYGKQKHDVSQRAPLLAQSLSMEYVHARFFSVYGPGDHPYTLIPSCIRCFCAGETMALSECTNRWNFLHVEDAAEATIQLMTCQLEKPTCLVNLAGTDTRVLKEFVEEIHRLAGGKGRCDYGARKTAETPVDNWPDVGLLQHLTGWVPRIPFDQGIMALIREEENRR